MSEITWGSEIAVDGKRPEWLGDMDWVTFRNTAAYSKKWSEQRLAQDIAFGGGCGSNPYVTLIRLPADHPQYAATKPHPAPSPSEVGPEVVLTAEQAEMLRGVLGFVYARQGPFAAEAAACLDLLPEPVDDDLSEARAIAEAQGYSSDYLPVGDSIVGIALAAIKRGRALEKEAGR